MCSSRFISIFIIAAFGLFGSSLQAQQSTQKIQTPTQLRVLVGDHSSGPGKAWRNLLFIKDEQPLMSQWKTDNKPFYQTSPGSSGWVLAELDAVLLELDQFGIQSPKVCEYPARFNWVYQQLYGSSIPFPLHCKALAEWIVQGHVQSIDLLFVSGYLSNPASTFGHTLLNVRAGLGAEHRSLEDSINYGALVPPGEGVVPYIFKGLFGGYSAGFSDGAYSAHMNTYQEKELRAIWRYELDLTESQRIDFVYRMAEVVTFKFPYYFLSENCGWAMGLMISEVSGTNLNISRSPTWFAPIELIHLLNDSRNSETNSPLVKKVYYTAAGQSVLQARYEALSENSRRLYRKLVQKPFETSQAVIAGQIPAATDTEYALDSALSYWQTINLDTEADLYIKEKDAILKARLSLPVKTPYVPKIEPYPNAVPHQSQKSGQLQMGVRHSDQRGNELKLKFSAFEQSDSTLHPLGVARGLSVFVFEAALVKGGLRFDESKLLAVSSVGVPDDTGLSEYGGLLSWRIDIGLGRRIGEPDYLVDLERDGYRGVVPKVSGAIGLSKTNQPRTLMVGFYLEPEVGLGEHPVTFGWLGKAQYRPDQQFSTTLNLRLRAVYSQVSANTGQVTAYGRQPVVFAESNSVFRVSRHKALNAEVYYSDLDHGAGIYLSHTF